jgi:putative ABC transport system permease protein
MLRATVKSLLAHKLRLALTTISVVLGVAFVAGTLVLTDTLNATFDTLFGEADAKTAVAVRARSSFEATDSGAGDTRRLVPAALVAKLRGVPGVSDVVPTVDGFAQLVDPKKRDVISNGAAPGLGTDWAESRLSPLHLTAGRAPAAPEEIAVDSETARKGQLTVGESVPVIVRTGIVPARVVGIFRFGSTGSLAGATLTAFERSAAQRYLLGTADSYSSIKLGAAPGVSQEQLRDRVATVVPSGFEAVTGTKLAAESASAVQEGVKFFKIFLLVFAAISLFVGSFIIVNTFTMLVAQRTRELALLRAIGASRGQVTRCVLGEALAVGLIASLVGLVAGIGVARVLQLLVNAFGGGLPTGGLVILARTPIWALAVGLGVTVAAAYPPARRAAKIPPVAALRDDVALPEASLLRRAIFGATLVVGGVAFLVAGLAGGSDQPAALVGLGATILFWGVRSLSPFLSRPAVRLLGVPMVRFAKVSGRLARDNALRNPRRTAATASALMIGMALVSAMTVMASSIKASAADVIDSSLGADFVVSTSSFQPFSTGVADRIRKLPGVQAVTSFRTGTAKVGVGSGQKQIQGVQPDTVGETLTLRMKSGDLAALARNELLINEKQAERRSWQVGQSVPVEFPATGRSTLRIGGIYADNQIAGSYLLSTAVFAKHYPRSLDLVVAVKKTPEAAASAVQAAVKRVAEEASPNVVVRDQTEFKAEQRKQVNQLLVFVTALLLFSVLIAVFGIINTLALSVFERTREIGLLRAVGMSRRQVRRMVRLESVIIAVFGALLGVVIGLGFGTAIVRALADEGVGQLVVPFGSLAGYVVLAAVIGVLAAILPARRAARLDVLQAVAAA